MGQKRTYKQYSKEYKQAAVALAREQGYFVPGAAKTLELASNMLYRWKDQIESQPGKDKGNFIMPPYLPRA